MGIAAYNRGTKAIADYLFPRQVFYKPPTSKPKVENNLGVFQPFA